MDDLQIETTAPANTATQEPSTPTVATRTPENTLAPTETIFITETPALPEVIKPLADGLIAFYSDRDGNPEIYAMNADGSHIRQLTDSPGFDENPAWSPDGSQIAFQSTRDGNFKIYGINPDGSQQHPLAVDPSDELWPSWGPANPPTPGAILFQNSEQSLASIPTWKIGLANLDGDGDLDIFLATFGMGKGPNEIWFNQGK